LNPFFLLKISSNQTNPVSKATSASPQRQSADWKKDPMELQYLEFDCSEDTEGVVCWDALAQPAASHTAALLREVTQLLAWASRFGPQGPGPLDEGADWDFDLQVQLHRANTTHSTPAQAQWQAAQQTLNILPAPGPEDRVELSLSLSGTPAFAQALREHWNAP
jgi:hypothetical protein